MTRRLLLTIVAGAAGMLARPVKGARYKARRANAASNRGKAAEAGAESGPLVFELTAEERWPIRGLDPVLHVGGIAIDSYQYGNAENTILLFTCYDPSGLQEGSEVHLQYGGDVSTRTELPNFRWNNVL